jgi:hypothetical protein
MKSRRGKVQRAAVFRRGPRSLRSKERSKSAVHVSTHRSGQRSIRGCCGIKLVLIRTPANITGVPGRQTANKQESHSRR